MKNGDKRIGTRTNDEIKELLADSVNRTIASYVKEGDLDPNDVSDGFHSFGELYKHRFHLYIALCKSSVDATDCMNMQLGYKCIRSKIHDDGLNVWEEWGMFLLCLHTPDGQISYHIDKEYWDKCDFAAIEEKATIKFDGHTSDDVLDRLLKL